MKTNPNTRHLWDSTLRPTALDQVAAFERKEFIAQCHELAGIASGVNKWNSELVANSIKVGSPQTKDFSPLSKATLESGHRSPQDY